MPQFAKLVPLVEKLTAVKALVIGDAMLDHYIVGNVDRISPEAPVPILQVKDEFDRVGGAANVAANITSLGASAALLALCGKKGTIDIDGQRLAQKCKERNIEAELIPALECTVRKSRVVAGQQQMIRVDWEKPFAKDCPESDFSAQISESKITELTSKCDVILVSDYAKGMLNAQLLENLKASGKPVIVDPRPQHKEFYKGVTLITPNRKEATEMLGVHERLPGEELGQRLGEKLECDILVTLGEEGMSLCKRGEKPLSIPTRAQEVYDVTGAGDTVAATFSLAVGAGLSMEEAALMANAAAGVVVGHVGCASITPSELTTALQHSPNEK